MNLADGAGRWVWGSVGVGILAAAVAAVTVPPAAAAGPLLVGFVVWFFRDPERESPAEGTLSPADGTVSVVRGEGERLRVGVFMNVWNVHVNRAPVAGRVVDVTHEPGLHRPAFTKDSDRNEKVHLDLATAGGEEMRVTLVAGAFARRIHPYVEGDEALSRGERVGHIAFGSRADVLFPPGVDRSDLAVSEGDAVRAGETVLVA
jgi:phosphatidylserine decarboxylase